MDEFSRGTWRYLPEKTKKDFVCCELNNDKTACEFSIKPAVCTCDFRDNTVSTVHEREKWEWVPDNCEALDYTPGKLCSLLENRSILIFGDSIAGENIYGLHRYFQRTPCAGKTIHAHPTEWSLARTVPDYSRDPHEADNTMHRILERAGKVDIAILNFGPWYHNMTMYEEGMKLLEEEIKIARRSAKTSHVQYIWRTNTVPHKDCMGHHKPFNLYEPHDRVDRYFPTGYESTVYDWQLFPLYDEYSKITMTALHIPWMDITPALSLRPDMHISEEDCLHSCLPKYLQRYLFLFIR
jgi:hypothetical protein